MKYEFPEIRTIDDVLPHIAFRDEFKVSDKGSYLSINYAVSFESTFDMSDGDILGGAIRRECRGLKFYPSGEIGARPFPKWFNIGEREETQPHALDFGIDHIIMTKVDGSMLYPMRIGDDIRWMTKAGITDVSEIAEKFIRENHKYNEFADSCIRNGVTPIFEYVGPYNKVVLEYPEENMILLAARNNISGQYLNIGV